MPSLADILLNVKNVSFDSLVCQKEIQTADDKKGLEEKGYPFVLTEKEFKKACSGVETSCVFYLPTLSGSTLYFNPQTLAVAPLHIEYLLADNVAPKNLLEGTLRAIEEREKEVKNKEFMGSILCLPDAMRLEYFERLIVQYQNIPNLYNLFFTHYTTSDFGFNNINAEVFKKVVDSKTAKDKAATQKALKGLPDIVQVYRGGSVDVSAKASEGYSWTTDINVANFFACRLGSAGGYIAIGEVEKEKIIEAYLDDSEKEVIVYPKDVKILSTMDIPGLDLCSEILPEVNDLYQKYRTRLHEMAFARKSDEHGLQHEARVLLLCLTIGKLLDLSTADMNVLATAAIYHDVKRTSDGEDTEHGKYSRAYYERTNIKKDPVVSFLIEFHSRPDEEGFEAIRSRSGLNKKRDRVELLYKVFKDADGLDRIRFGIRDLDLNFLRLPVSKTLTLVARLYHDNIKA